MADPAAPESIDAVSADLPYELQSKLFDQLATMGVGGAGVVITLRGSLLADASPVIWMGAVEFGIAALLALVAQFNLIEGLFARRSTMRSARLLTMAAAVLIGMGVGTVGMSVFLEAETPHTESRHAK